MNKHRSTMTLLGFLLLASCGGSSEDDNNSALGNNNNGNGPVGWYDYLNESATYDATTNSVEVVALYAPDEPGLDCNALPVSELRYRFVWPSHKIEGWGVHLFMFEHTSISREEYQSRRDAMNIHYALQEFELPPVGWLRIYHRNNAPLYWGQRIQGPEGEAVAVSEDGSNIFAIYQDLGTCGQETCGDGLCDESETPETCTVDCGCGDGVLAAHEACDGTNLRGLTCTDFGFEPIFQYCAGCQSICFVCQPDVFFCTPSDT